MKCKIKRYRGKNNFEEDAVRSSTWKNSQIPRLTLVNQVGQKSEQVWFMNYSIHCVALQCNNHPLKKSGYMIVRTIFRRFGEFFFRNSLFVDFSVFNRAKHGPMDNICWNTLLCLFWFLAIAHNIVWLQLSLQMVRFFFIRVRKIGQEWNMFDTVGS